MKVHNKFLSLLLIGSLLAGCSNQATEVAEPTTVETEAPEVTEVAETEEATETEETAEETETTEAGSDVLEGEGRGHEAGLKVAVTMDGDKIANVEVVEHNESDGIADQALVDVPKAIAEHNSIAVDGVSGATETSDGIKAAVEAALVAGGLNVDNYKTEVAKNEEGEDVTYDTDVLVVGGGIAGLSAAIEAQDNGADVILIEKLPRVGGSTILSGGYILAAESFVQEEAGIESSWEDLANYLYEVSEGEANKDMLDKIAQQSGENIKWLADKGMVFDPEITKLHSTHEHAWGHAPEGKAYTANGGPDFINPLEADFKDNGGELLYETWATELIEYEGAVTGAVATNVNNDNITINAKKVILATGGFNASEEMVAEHHPYIKNLIHGGSPGNTGDGIIMAEELGAATNYHDSGIDITTHHPTYYGYGEEFKGLFVLPDATRFVDESIFHFQRTRVLMDLDENGIWAITDQGNERIDEGIELGTAFKAESIEELAEKAGLDPDQLVKTVEAYNAACELGEDDEFGKPAEFMVPIEGPEYYALMMNMTSSGTIGGLVVDELGKVLTEDGEVIENLYAVGELANEALLYKGYPGSGTSIMLCLYQGRVAGADAAK